MELSEAILWKKFNQRLNEGVDIDLRNDIRNILKGYVRDQGLDPEYLKQYSRSPSELFRIGSQQVYEVTEEYITSPAFLEALKATHPNIVMAITKDDSGALEKKPRGSGTASGEYSSIELVIDDNGILNHLYLTDMSTGKRKKVFIPNKLIKDFSAKYDAEDLINTIAVEASKLKGFESYSEFLVELLRSSTACRATDNQLDAMFSFFAGKVVNVMQNPSNNSAYLSFPKNARMFELLKDLAYDPTFQQIKSSINVDFAEVFGAVALLSAVKNAPNCAEYYANYKIKYPEASNEPLVDYYLTPGGVEEGVQISAKTGAGGKPTNGSIMQTAYKTLLAKKRGDAVDVGINFLKEWIDRSEGTVHESFEHLADWFEGMIKGTCENYLTEFSNMVVEGSIDPAILVNYITPEDIDSINNASTTQEVVDAYTAIAYKSTPNKGARLKDATEEQNADPLYRDAMKIKAKVSLFINILNNSYVIDFINTWFNIGMGNMVQIYFLGDVADDSPECTFRIQSNATHFAYKFSFDCNIDNRQKKFTTKKLAMALMHEGEIKERKRMIEKYLREEVTDPEDTVVVAFGRLNPPTLGHLKLINKMATLASQRSNCKARIYLSHSHDPEKNPLTYESKLQWVDKAFGDYVDVADSDAKNMFYMMHELYEEGFKHVIYVCGEDRFEETSKYLSGANGQEFTKSGKPVAENLFYRFNSLTFEDAGHRDENSNDLEERASASLARSYVMEDRFDLFEEIVPLSEGDASELFIELQNEMGL